VNGQVKKTKEKGWNKNKMEVVGVKAMEWDEREGMGRESLSRLTPDQRRGGVGSGGK